MNYSNGYATPQTKMDDCNTAEIREEMKKGSKCNGRIYGCASVNI